MVSTPSGAGRRSGSSRTVKADGSGSAVTVRDGSLKRRSVNGGSVAELDELPGSLMNGTPNGSGSSTPVLGNGYAGAGAGQQYAPAATSPARWTRRAEPTSRRRLEQQQTSNWILRICGLPLAVLMLADQLYPSPQTISSHHTRLPSYHLSTLSSKFLHLSYQMPSAAANGTSNYTRLAPSSSASNALYLKGIDDVYIVCFWVIAFTFLREATIRFFWVPLAKAGGVYKVSTQLRFGEQGWNIVYFGIICPCGVWIMQHSPYRNFNLAGLWQDYPHYQLTWQMKTYYLAHAGFWLHQIISVNMEKRRKDYYQMLAHHILTVSLLSLSYTFNFTRVGNVILILMDPSDVLLAIAKHFKYLGYETACNVGFVVFMVGWIITRHWLYNLVYLSVVFELNTYIAYDWSWEREHFWNEKTRYIFIGLLTALQLLLVMWFFMIVKVALGVVLGGGAEDSRSDDESDDSEPGSPVPADDKEE